MWLHLEGGSIWVIYLVSVKHFTRIFIMYIVGWMWVTLCKLKMPENEAHISLEAHQNKFAGINDFCTSQLSDRTLKKYNEELLFDACVACVWKSTMNNFWPNQFILWGSQYFKYFSSHAILFGRYSSKYSNNDQITWISLIYIYIWWMLGVFNWMCIIFP